MKHILIGCLTLFLSVNSFAYNFIGVYKCKGYDPYLKRNYSGTVTIAAQNTVYKITMDYDTGEKYKATGGPYSTNLLSVVFQDINKPDHVGLEQYTLSEDEKKMGGFWVYLGKDKLGEEICEKLS